MCECETASSSEGEDSQGRTRGTSIRFGETATNGRFWNAMSDGMRSAERPKADHG
jgi:hypothetical protein